MKTYGIANGFNTQFNPHLQQAGLNSYPAQSVGQDTAFGMKKVFLEGEIRKSLKGLSRKNKNIIVDKLYQEFCSRAGYLKDNFKGRIYELKDNFKLAMTTMASGCTETDLKKMWNDKTSRKEMLRHFTLKNILPDYYGKGKGDYKTKLRFSVSRTDDEYLFPNIEFVFTDKLDKNKKFYYTASSEHRNPLKISDILSDEGDMVLEIAFTRVTESAIKEVLSAKANKERNLSALKVKKNIKAK